MVAIQRRGLLSYLLSTLALLLGLGVFGYITMMSLPASKTAAERYLMVAVVLAILAITGAVLLYRRGQNINRTLQIAEHRLRQGGFSMREFFESRRLGSLGENLAEIYRGMEEISEKKSLRIGSLNALNQFLLDLVPEPLVAVNAKGEIFQASTAFLTKFEAKRGDVAGQDVTKLLTDFDLDAAVNHFYRDGTAIDLNNGEEKSRVYPVFDARRELAYFVVIFGKNEEVELPEQPEPVPPQPRSRRGGLFGGLFGRSKS